MKKMMLVIMALVMLLPLAQARGIVGKWYCSQTVLDSLGVGIYPKITGYYKFKDDGTFTVRISGELQMERPGDFSPVWTRKPPKWRRTNAKYQTLLIKVKGSYTTDGNAITTKVDSGDVDVYIDTGLDYPEDTGIWASRGEIYWKVHNQRRYEAAESHASVHAATIRRERMHVWRWTAEPLSVTADSLRIGSKFRLYKDRKLAGRGKPRKYHNVNLMSLRNATKAIYNKKSSEKKRRWAVRTLVEAATLDSSAYAMNTLGFAYLSGRGVERDTAEAISWLKRSEPLGNKAAYYNIGLIYKHGKGDLEQAYKYFSEGAERGHRECLYAKGYMLYKGLGCGQDYQEAVKTLLDAANDRDADSWYMLGLCSRNGYGLVKDSAAGAFCLNRAARMGSRDARDELARPHEETYLHEIYMGSEEYSFIPVPVPEALPGADGSTLAEGTYRGFVVMYDWSGEYAIREMPLVLTVGRSGTGLAGAIAVGSDSASYRAAVTADGKILFKDSRLTLPERYERSGRMDYRLDSMALSAAEDKVCGRLSLYSEKLKEPGRPMYFELRRE